MHTKSTHQEDTYINEEDKREIEREPEASQAKGHRFKIRDKKSLGIIKGLKKKRQQIKRKKEKGKKSS